MFSTSPSNNYLFIFPFGEALADMVKEPIHSDVPLSRKRLRCIAHQAVEKAYSGPLTCIIREILSQIPRHKNRCSETAPAMAPRPNRVLRQACPSPVERSRDYCADSILITGPSGSEGSSTSTTRSAPLAQALAHPINMQEFIHRLQRMPRPSIGPHFIFVQSMHALIA